VKALPPAPTAAQKLALGHDTDKKALLPLMSEGDDHEDPLYVKTLPDPLTATQKLALAHDTELRLPLLPSMAEGADHADPL
jgi:hypothetical protein